ncbi:MAG TPA: ABC transporter permease [Caldilineae bacterium]|nr:ABC transporter permease [Caldilineae bacterium]
MLFRIWNLVVKEFIQFRRDRLFSTFILLFPVIQLLMLAQATGQGVTHLPTAVWDQDQSALSRELITSLDVTEELDVLYYPQRLQDAERLLAEGKATTVIIIPAGFAREVMRPSSPPQVQVLVDGSNNVMASVALATAEGVIAEFAHKLSGAMVRVVQVPVELRPAIRFNPSLNIQYHMIPAQVGFIIYQVTLAVAATALARERELGTLEQLAITPMNRFELVTGKAIPAAVLGIVDFAFLFSLMIYGFHIPMRGSLPLLVLTTLLFIAVEIGWGMLISSASHTQQQAILLVFIVAMTDVSLSGYLVPVKNMPGFLQTISMISAIRHYLTALRAIMLKGADLVIIWREIAALLGLALAVSTISILTVQRRLD